MRNFVNFFGAQNTQDGRTKPLRMLRLNSIYWILKIHRCITEKAKFINILESNLIWRSEHPTSWYQPRYGVCRSPPSIIVMEPTYGLAH